MTAATGESMADDTTARRAPLEALAGEGVSIWLDDLSRERIESGNLQEVIDGKGVVGVTTNPSIFQAALADGEAYTSQIEDLAEAGASVEDAVFALMTDDVRAACDIFMPLYEATDGVDGRVSLEVDPRLAHETGRTVEQAKILAESVDRPNLLIKIPATIEGLPAITQVLAAGVSVNVTLIFSLDRYRAVMSAFLTGLEQAREAGKDLSRIHSVASFFVSRVDTEVDNRLEEIGTDEALALRGQAAVANARLAYQAYEEVFSTPRWQNLADEGARPQRPLWASTGVKNPSYPDTMYVAELVAPGTVNTLPEKTLDATIDHGDLPEGVAFPDPAAYAAASKVLDDLAQVGVSYTEVTDLLEEQGVASFEKSWNTLLQGVSTELEKASA
ncbi:MAG: transaldolase [Actinomycetia bacterium]|nr:transaldolase [Actinomycetes bacterium]